MDVWMKMFRRPIWCMRADQAIQLTRFDHLGCTKRVNLLYIMLWERVKLRQNVNKIDIVPIEYCVRSASKQPAPSYIPLQIMYDVFWLSHCITETRLINEARINGIHCIYWIWIIPIRPSIDQFDGHESIVFSLCGACENERSSHLLRQFNTAELPQRILCGIQFSFSHFVDFAICTFVFLHFSFQLRRISNFNGIFLAVQSPKNLLSSSRRKQYFTISTKMIFAGPF